MFQLGGTLKGSFERLLKKLQDEVLLAHLRNQTPQDEASRSIPDADLLSFRAVLVKGRANYLCPHRLERAMRDAKSLFVGPEQTELRRIAEWARKTKDGSLSDLDIQPDPKVWSEVCSERGICTPKICEADGQSCFFQQAIVGEGVTLTVEHLKEMRAATIGFHLSKHLLFTKYRDPGEEPRLHLFGQLKAIVRQWLDAGNLRCTGGTFPAQVLYREIAEMACERIKTAITETLQDQKQIKAILDPYNPVGSSLHINFTTSKALRWKTDGRKCHINWIVCDSDWEAEFCRVA